MPTFKITVRIDNQELESQMVCSTMTEAISELEEFYVIEGHEPSDIEFVSCIKID
jgi:hypothetical protein